MKKYGIYILCLIMLTAGGCSIKYAMNQYSLPPGMQTFSVQYFPNRSELVRPSLSQKFTEALRDKVESQTPLRLVTDLGQGDFSGEIVGYTTSPINITADDAPAQNRLTISIKVIYTNQLDPEMDFEQVFNRFEDYPSTESLESVEDELVQEIFDLILEDIFNAAFVNW